MRRLFLASFAALPLLAACAPAELRTPEARVVFFERDDIELDAPARAVVAESAAIANRYPIAPVRVLGYASTNPSAFPGGSTALSRVRAEAVVAALRASGVAPTRISQVAVGPVPFESVPTESRRVEIRIGG